MKTYTEPSRLLTVHTSCDVLVVGGGTAGVVAALAAARTGADTVLIEQSGFLGGTMHGGVCGVHSFFNNYQAYGVEKKQLVKGIPGEIAQRMMDRGGCPGHIPQERGVEHFGVVTTFDREMYKQLAFEMMEESGVRLYMHCFFCDVVKDEEGNPCGVIIESKNGREVIEAKRIVDTTGDGDVAFRAGCELFPNPEPYTAGMLFAMANVDIPRLVEYLDSEGVLENLARADKGSDRDPYIRVATHFHGNDKLKAMANKLGIWGLFTFSCHENELTYVNGSNAEGLENFSPEELTRVEVETRRAVTRMSATLKSTFPGFERAYVTWTSSQAGIRRTRVIMCEHDLTSDEVENCARFPDEIGLYGFHDMAPVRVIKNGGWYGIPYRALVPLKVENLLVAGRMITSDKNAHMSTRNSASCMVQGQAAGTAAALSVREGVTPRALDPEKLRDRLRRDGVCLEA